MKKSIRKAGTILLAGFSVIALSACVGPRPEQQAIGLQYEGGQFIKTARNFIKCVPGGVRGDYDFGGVSAFYPADQRYVDFSGGDGADRGPIVVKSKDGVDLAVPGVLYYYLNTDCGTGEGKEAESSPIVQFDLNLGRRANASFDENDMSKVPQGWREVQKRYIEVPLEAIMGRESLKYEWRDLVFDAAKRTEWQDNVLKALPTTIHTNAPTDVEFWKSFQFIVQVPTLSGDAGAKAQEAIVNGQRLVAEAQAKEAQANAEAAAAAAQVAVAEAQAKAKAAEIAPFGSVREYNFYLCITRQTNPCNPFQPQIGSSVTQVPLEQPSN